MERPLCKQTHVEPAVYRIQHNVTSVSKILIELKRNTRFDRTQGKIDLRNESGRPMKVKVVGEVSEK